MLPGPRIIIACPHCGALANYLTLLSGNTFGARIWSDGKQIAPMLPVPPSVVKCHGCHDLYWRKQAKAIGEREEDPNNESWRQAPEVREPDESDYYDFLDKPSGRPSDETEELRMYAWLRRNDVFRCDDPPVDSPDPRWRANAEALLACLNEEPVQRMFAIELNRELGRPGAALAILDRLEIPEESELKRALRALCESGDTRVRELKLY
jgi:hypothetical protein